AFKIDLSQQRRLLNCDVSASGRVLLMVVSLTIPAVECEGERYCYSGKAERKFSFVPFRVSESGSFDNGIWCGCSFDIVGVFILRDSQVVTVVNLTDALASFFCPCSLKFWGVYLPKVSFLSPKMDDFPDPSPRLNPPSTPISDEVSEAVLPGADHAVSDRPLTCVVPMDEVVIESLRVSLPFTKFEVSVLNFLMVAPSQIHPSGWAFFKAYQFWFAYAHRRLSLRLFFTLFHVTRSKEGGCFGLISFNQPDRLFEDFTDIPDDFLHRFYWVSPVGRDHNRQCTLAPTDDHGWLLNFADVCSRKFRHYWSWRHFTLPVLDCVNEGNLTNDAAASERALRNYVNSLEDVVVPDPRDPSGKKRVFRKRYNDTELILSEPSSKGRDVIFRKYLVVSERRVPSVIAFKTPLGEKRKAPAVVAGKGKTVFVGDDAFPTCKKIVKRTGEGSSTVYPRSSPLVEVLPLVKQSSCGDVHARACVYPSRPLGGSRTGVDVLTERLKETSFREEKAVEGLRELEHQVLVLSKKLKGYEDSELGSLRKENVDLKSHIHFLESELQAFRRFRYSVFKDANEKAARLEKEKDDLSLSHNELIRRSLGLVPAVFYNAVSQVELYLGKPLPRDRFSYRHYVKDEKLVPQLCVIFLAFPRSEILGNASNQGGFPYLPPRSSLGLRRMSWQLNLRSRGG
ncbi:hypothetical protein A2U01_0000676, partial [Trifolium medium]|nr:hypothetical protein [Trifolium medium]